MRGIRQGRPFQPLVTYNTWFARGTRIIESEVAQEMDRAASLGVELFVLDAGWYLGAGIDDQRRLHLRSRLVEGRSGEVSERTSFDSPIWRTARPEVRIVVRARTRGALARRRAGHAAGRVAGDTGRHVRRPAQRSTLLASDDARQWVFNRIVQVLDEVRPDYLKWDNNFWINCNREGHSHGPETATTRMSSRCTGCSPSCGNGIPTC